MFETQVGRSRVKKLWELRDAKDRSDPHRDQSHATKIERREDVCQELRSAYFKSPTFALSEALAESGNVGRCGVVGWKGAEADFMCVSSCAVSGRLDQAVRAIFLVC